MGYPDIAGEGGLETVLHAMQSADASSADAANHGPKSCFLFHSILWLFGFIPMDLHWLGLESIGEAGFQEASSSLLQRVWRHRRTITRAESSPLDAPNYHDACTNDGNTELLMITDEVEFLPRVPLLGYLLLPIVNFIFQHRHRRLRAMFDGDRDGVPYYATQIK